MVNNIHSVGSIHVSSRPSSPCNIYGGSWKLLCKTLSLKYSYGEEFNIKSSIYRYSIQTKFKCIKCYLSRCTNYSLLRNKININDEDLFKILYIWERIS